jgi:hypothetical protein
MFRIRYVVEAREAGHAEDEFVMEIGKESFKEFSQHHMDEVIVSTRELSATDYMNLFDTDNDYLKSWDIEQKMSMINTIEYQDENFVTHTETFNGITARVILHEYDHIEGKLFIDYLKPLRKKLLQGKLNDISKGKARIDYKMIFIK